MDNKRKEIPNSKGKGKGRSEDEEREFWATHDTTEYIDWTKAQRATFPNLKPSTKTISLRLSAFMLNDLRVMANKRDVPYQSLIKMILQEKIDADLHRKDAKS